MARTQLLFLRTHSKGPKYALAFLLKKLPKSFLTCDWNSRARLCLVVISSKYEKRDLFKKKQVLSDGNREFGLTRACIKIVLQLDRNYHLIVNIIIFIAKKSILGRF